MHTYLTGMWPCSAAFPMETEQEIQINIAVTAITIWLDSYIVWNTTLKPLSLISLVDVN